jgi:glycosyltransferase involved in cell wall biosynthesis
LIIYGSLDTVSGGYLYDRMLVRYLESQGDQVQVISLPWRTYLQHLGDNFSKSFRSRLANLKLDILLQDELNHPSLFGLNSWLRRKWRESTPILSIVHHLRCSEHRPGWQNWIYRWVERQYLRNLDGFIYNSQATRRSVENLIGQVPPHIVAYPAGDRFNPNLSAAAIEQRARERGPLRLLFIGNLIPRKGLHILIHALGLLSPDEVVLDVVGNPRLDVKYASTVWNQVVRLGLLERINWHGALPDSALSRLLRDCQVLVVPSSYEGLGIVYLEGMSYGLPAIACSNGGAGEIITHGLDGFLLDAVDPRLLAEYILELARDRALLVEMSLAARRRYLHWPTWEDMGNTVREFLVSFEVSHARS